MSIIKCFPLIQLGSASREELIQSLFKLTFYSDPEVRSSVYTFFGQSVEFWKTCGEIPRAISILIQSLGDHDPDW